ncbi:GNAT family N-acetyltransferase [Actinoallomurus purpureus]|uniref:GNAT family N-acetyltransferase n=1 Tax=Actinoallomurus purpureus TaxID=478114 RepID=UPI00209212FC|nr:GNAT family N-acetyltransferase [Actinoallomurus purpureus]MCO6010218.1 GNAT family N-acetyltransferase [Actinoallomurus purpureus]
MSTVTLQPVDENLLPRLLEIAIADTDPHEVMPDVPVAPRWNDASRAAFDEYHRPGDGAAYAVLVDGQLAGAARITPAEAPGAVQAYIWLGRSARGKGYSTEALRLLIDEARAHAASALIAETHVSNTAAVSALRTLGAMLWEDPETGSVHATLRVGEAD